MKILLIRHGDPDYTIDSLTEKGWREAKLLSNRLEKLEIRDFYVSPLGRARATVQPTLEKLNRTAEVLPWLAEFRGWVEDPFGQPEPQHRIPWNLMPQYWTKFPELFDRDHWMEHPLMATGTLRQIVQETNEGVDALLERYGYKRDGMIFHTENNTTDTICLVCHYGVGMAILSHLLGVALPVLWGSFMLPTTSVTTLVTEERVPGEVFFRCFQMGDTAHLYAGGEPNSQAGMFKEKL